MASLSAYFQKSSGVPGGGISDKHADFSSCRTWRYRLSRVWASDRPHVLFVMLNPSVADETRDDRTIRRCMDFAQRWGYGGLEVGNLFAFCATRPEQMQAAPDPVGPGNDAALRHLARDAARIVIAWGARGEFRGRDREVVELLRSVHSGDLLCLKRTQEGHPRHPLYVRGDVEPQAFGLLEEIATERMK